MPEYIKLSRDSNNFMFGILVQSMPSSSSPTEIFDLVNGPQIFDYKLTSFSFEKGVRKAKSIIM